MAVSLTVTATCSVTDGAASTGALSVRCDATTPYSVRRSPGVDAASLAAYDSRQDVAYAAPSVDAPTPSVQGHSTPRAGIVTITVSY
jgi:spore coat protein U-like protein